MEKAENTPTGMNISRMEKLINEAIEWAKSPPDYGCNALYAALDELTKLKRRVELLEEQAN